MSGVAGKSRYSLGNDWLAFMDAWCSEKTNETTRKICFGFPSYFIIFWFAMVAAAE